MLGLGPYRGRRNEVFAAWEQSIEELARHPNVYVKVGSRQPFRQSRMQVRTHLRDSQLGTDIVTLTWRGCSVHRGSGSEDNQAHIAWSVEIGSGGGPATGDASEGWAFETLA